MLISIIIPPPSCFTPATDRTAEKPKTQTAEIDSLAWANFAANEQWEEAIISLVGSRRGENFPLWQAVNMVVAESLQPSRSEIRRTTAEVLTTVMRLVRLKRVNRIKKKWISMPG